MRGVCSSAWLGATYCGGLSTAFPTPILAHQAPPRQVKFSMLFRGREVTHSEVGRHIMLRMAASLEETGETGAPGAVQQILPHSLTTRFLDMLVVANRRPDRLSATASWEADDHANQPQEEKFDVESAVLVERCELGVRLFTCAIFYLSMPTAHLSCSRRANSF